LDVVGVNGKLGTNFEHGDIGGSVAVLEEGVVEAIPREAESQC
jgi:hypothetical protein